MKISSVAAAALILGTLLAPIVMAQDTDADRSHPKAFIKDSVITTKIKSKLAAENLTSLGHIQVDTDKDGVVWLSGTAHSEQAVEKALQIARDTDGVRDVRSTVNVKKDD
jgi:hyperosmotically inducible protein